MKVLFVSSGNTLDGVTPFIRSQGDALGQNGVAISYFPITGKGMKNYIGHIRPLRRHIRENGYDLVHAHYTLCGWVAVLAGSGKPVVLSLMGDDAYGEYVGVNRVAFSSRWLTLATWMIQPFVDVLISKSANIERYVYRKRISHIVPNGVRLDQFRLFPGGCREELGLSRDKKYVLFLGDKSLGRKNYALADAAVRLLGRPDVELIAPYPVSHDTVVKYLNSVDVFVLCSYMEGSANVLKEAMACNCPVVATDVGDSAWVIGQTPGCHVSSFDPAAFSQKLASALDFSERTGRTQGRQRLAELGLSAQDVSKRLFEIYSQLLGALK